MSYQKYFSLPHIILNKNNRIMRWVAFFTVTKNPVILCLSFVERRIIAQPTGPRPRNVSRERVELGLPRPSFIQAKLFSAPRSKFFMQVWFLWDLVFLCALWNSTVSTPTTFYQPNQTSFYSVVLMHNIMAWHDKNSFYMAFCCRSEVKVPHFHCTRSKFYACGLI